MSSLPLNVVYYGQKDALPEQLDLQAGPWSATFEQGQLLNIRWRRQEILHRIYAAVRDRNWGTVPLQMSNLHVRQEADSFQVAFDARHRRDEIDFAWRGRIEAAHSGRLTFSLEGEALSKFLRSRIGFCLLHSARECAGKHFSAHRPDGSVAKGLFPKAIAQEEPITGTEAMTALSYNLSHGLQVRIQFDGDIFQMEDQRAWTDASFKTFCTPLDLPCPVEIEKGTRVSQAVRLVLNEDDPLVVTSSSKNAVFITVETEPSVPVPEIGLGTASHGDALTDLEIERLRTLRVSHLRVDLRLWEPGWRTLLQRASQETRRLGCSLEAALFVSNSAQNELKILLDVLHEEQPRICRWLIFHSTEKAVSERWILLARSCLQPWNPSARFGSGTNAYFYQLKAFRPPSNGLDFVCFSIHPQEHSDDNTSLVETLEMQGVVVNNAQRLFDRLPVGVNAVTMKPRFSPDATGPVAPPPPGELPRQVDVRQMSLFGACWTLGSLKYLSESGANSITYYETTGWRGVMERDVGSPLPKEFPSTPSAVFPLYHVLADVGEFAGGEVLPSRSSEPLKALCMAISKHKRRRVLLANMTGKMLQTCVRGLPAQVRLKSLDEFTAWKAMVDPEEFRNGKPVWRNVSQGALMIELPPHSVTRIDTGRE